MSVPRKAVVVVDDDPLMLKAMERLLKAHGFDVKMFESAEALLGCVAASGASCLVLDINLVGISGIELGRCLTERGYRLPIIFITAVDNEATHQEAMDTGCVAYLRKPFQARELIGAINKATG